MVRGNSLIDDLRLLINNPRYSDLEIRCKDDLVLYGNRVILAARSEVFERILFTGTRASDKQVSFPKIEASSMKVILEYLYTGTVLEKGITIEDALKTLPAADFFQLENLQDLISEYNKKMCEKEENRNRLPELLSNAVQLMSPLAENGVVDYLVDSVAKIPLDSIGFNRLSLQGLQCLLSKRNEEKTFNSSEYSVLRYAILSAANKVSQEAFSILEKRLPPWNEIKESALQDIDNNNSIEKTLGASIGDIINPVIEHIDFRRIKGIILAKIIEPLDIIPYNKIMDSYRFQVCKENPLSEYYGYFRISDIRWDRNGCGLGLNISEYGRTVNAPQNITQHQSVRTNYLMSSGAHEFRILIEKNCAYAFVGICGEGLNFSTFAGYQPYGWVLSSSGDCVHDNDNGIHITPTFQQDNVKIIVHLNMDDKTVAFSVNDTRYPPVASWNNLPRNLYFVASLRYPGKFKILPPEV
ncbi:16830_t:CDS:1 [Acaulospora morrowiae]|uniref:16830_t:CDS:1 n=1 Tax=Acaulospora morrowiae TaxID=94023 RepID=A0A9N9ALV3_9GLOM|nr:16830_t:CDS:1 [Acaulospora morrowiae]